MQNSNENEVLTISFYRKTRHVIIDDYKTVDDKHTNINNRSFI